MAIKSETQIARQLFLYGAGDGKRVLSAKALCKATGLHEATIQRHMGKWQKESEELLSGASDCGVALHLSRETLDAHDRDMIVLRGQINQIAFELKNIERITARLEGWIDKFDGEDGEKDQALRILEAWQRNCGQKAALRSQFLALQKQWVSLSGVADMQEIQATREKTIVVGKAKLELKKEENNAGIRDVSSSLSPVFQRD